MMNLLKVAALPGSGGGCMSAHAEAPPAKKFGPSMTHQEMAAHLDALMGVVKRLLERVASLEVATTAKAAEQPVKVQMKAPYFDDLDWPSIVFLDEEPAE